ncbi:hypothetical protein HF086_016821 [Spodoptera exigua]|uniref:Uncharacterized protein n=1 Tax=Spodoptera exigua TaxID=7107 RepID=A0A922M6N6_SPOEX|nr:hypothetical protein HF086_016821 [Spodoptera exigua]
MRLIKSYWGSLSESEKSNRKRRSCSSVFDHSQSQKRRRISPVASTSQDSRIECLEKNMDSMFALLLERIDTHHQQQTNLAQTMEPDSDSEEHSGSESTGRYARLLQRKALAGGLKNIRKKCPDADDELRKLLADDSQFKVLSDDLLQFLCAHYRAETKQARRRAYKAKNVPPGAALLHSIPPPSSFYPSF